MTAHFAILCLLAISAHLAAPAARIAFRRQAKASAPSTRR